MIWNDFEKLVHRTPVFSRILDKLFCYWRRWPRAIFVLFLLSHQEKWNIRNESMDIFHLTTRFILIQDFSCHGYHSFTLIRVESWIFYCVVHEGFFILQTIVICFDRRRKILVRRRKAKNNRMLAKESWMDSSGENGRSPYINFRMPILIVIETTKMTMYSPMVGNCRYWW